jgi:hypothetical protein
MKSCRTMVAPVAVASLMLASLTALSPSRAQAAVSSFTGWRAASTGLPALAAPASTADRVAAWRGLSATRQQQALDDFAATVGPRLHQAIAGHTPVTSAEPSWQQIVSGQAGVAASPFLSTTKATPPSAVVPQSAASGSDDGDGLPAGFKSGLADAFTPFYHVSAGEADGFATFRDSVPQQVLQVFGPTPPISYFRVKPLGFTLDPTGTQFSVLRIDYLTLWNKDDGLSLGGSCIVNANVISDLLGVNLLGGLGGHPLDNERSAALVAAPAPGPFQINTDPNAYRAYAFYTAAHEGVPLTDHSELLFPSAPVPAGNHIELALAGAKHSTYPFNPDGQPIIQDWVISAAYGIIQFLFDVGLIDDIEYLTFLFIADQVFFSCVVEHFSDQGGQFAATRIDVGEPEHPINGAGFIQDRDSGILGKLTGNVFPFFESGQAPPTHAAASHPAVLGSPNSGDLGVFFNSDGRLAENVFTRSTDRWSGPMLLPGGNLPDAVSPVAIGNPNGGNIAVFFNSGAGLAYDYYLGSTNTWGGPFVLAGDVRGDPTVLGDPNQGNIAVFYASTSGQLKEDYYVVATNSWSGAFVVAAAADTTPTAIGDPNGGNIAVFYTASGVLYERFYFSSTNSWVGPWTLATGVTGHLIVLGSPNGGNVAVFYTYNNGGANQLREVFYLVSSNSFVGPWILPGTPVGAPVAGIGSPNSGNIALFFNAAGSLVEDQYLVAQNNFAGPAAIGGQVQSLSQPAAVGDPNTGNIAVFFESTTPGQGFALTVNNFLATTGSWTGPVPIGGVIT